jgi:phosphatidylglycerophosphate synthase
MIPPIRIQTNIVAQSERRLINWICARLPLWIGSDHLTAIGVFGACLVFLGYLASWSHPGFLWLAVFGYLVHWFGDSLDGSLARYRKTERPRYGYFLDHSVDALCNFIIMMGFGIAQYTRLDVALLALLGYYMLCMYTFLNNQVTGKFQLTFLACGPTELRIGLMALTISMYCFGGIGLHIGQTFLSVYDLVLVAMSCTFVCLFVGHVWAGIVRLYEEEPLKGVTTSEKSGEAVSLPRRLAMGLSTSQK